MRYWLLTCNPRTYPIDERLRDPDPALRWRITRYHDDIMPGDLAFAWRIADPEGVCAVLEISASAEVVDETTPGDVDCVDIEFGPVYVVDTVLVDRGFVLRSETLRADRGLNEMSVFREPGRATAYRLSRLEAERLLELIEAVER